MLMEGSWVSDLALSMSHPYAEDSPTGRDWCFHFTHGGTGAPREEARDPALHSGMAGPGTLAVSCHLLGDALLERGQRTAAPLRRSPTGNLTGKQVSRR